MPRKKMTLKQRRRNWDRLEKMKDQAYKKLFSDMCSREGFDNRHRSREAHSVAAWEHIYHPRLSAVIVKYINEDDLEMAIVLTREIKGKDKDRALEFDLVTKYKEKVKV